MRNMHPLVRLIASLVFGLSVLAFFFFVSAEMAAHYFQGVAERTVRQAFTEGIQTKDRVRYEAVCRSSESDHGRSLECDPALIRAERSLRSTSCSGRGLLRLLGRQWSCVAKFTDGATLGVDVSIGFGRPRLEIALPVREPDAT